MLPTLDYKISSLIYGAFHLATNSFVQAPNRCLKKNCQRSIFAISAITPLIHSRTTCQRRWIQFGLSQFVNGNTECNRWMKAYRSRLHTQDAQIQVNQFSSVKYRSHRCISACAAEAFDGQGTRCVLPMCQFGVK